MSDSPSLVSVMGYIPHKRLALGVEESSPLIASANLLHISHVQMLPIVRGLQSKTDPVSSLKMYPTLGGYTLLKSLLRTDPSSYKDLLWGPSRDFASWIGSVKETDTLDFLLKVFSITRFGDAFVESSGDKRTLLTLNDIIALYRNDILKSTITVEEIGSRMVVTSSDSLVLEAVRMMFDNGIRRVFLEEKRRERDLSFVSDRHILRFLFSPSRLQMIRDTPERWLDVKLSEIETTEAKIIGDGRIVNQAAKEIGDRTTDCLVSESTNKVVSRWDIVMKPWKANNYSYAGKRV